MACCEGNCSCGKNKQSPVQENIHLVQLSSRQGKLSTFDWMKGLGNLKVDEDVVEVRFKNNRKSFYRNTLGKAVSKDDRIVVEVDGGHDVGTVSLTGQLADKQHLQKNPGEEKATLKRIYRKATRADLDNWLKAKRRERDVLLEARKLAGELGLVMSISDVEFQGDGRKATVFYTAESRVDFRELVKRYASAFQVRIEMRQIGVRQEAAKIGGIGSCGRELCCSTWKTGMNSVKTEAVKFQGLSLSPSKLAGQCGKLKCCLNYELETYLEAWEQFPARLIELETDRGLLVPLQPDILNGTVLYGESTGNARFEIPVEQVKRYISLNKKGKLVESALITSTNNSAKSEQPAFN